MTAPLLTIQPLPFDPMFEQIPDDEADTVRELIDALHQIQQTAANDCGHALRGLHAKSHGLLDGELTVAEGLPPPLAQGLFARRGSYRVTLRLSTTPGDLLDDAVSTPRGLALKLADVDGERLPGSEALRTQDFVMVNAPAFSAPTPKAFVRSLKLLAQTTGRAPGGKRALSAVMRGAERMLEAAGVPGAALKNLGGHPASHLLGETFYTCAPCLYGPYFAKLAVVPVSPELVALKGAPLDLKGRPDALRDEVVAFFARHGGVWELRVQLATDLERMPVEDASAVWPEDASPYLTVATLRVVAQPAWSAARARVVDDGMSFSPWHGLAAHRPLGGVMRARRPAYAQSAAFRERFNGCPVHG
ncbi:catalase family protein [Burkholderia glumae]|uniref:catalase family protein n=2 Tax=Burkholderia glumae TaxID=337 RepID=UPI0020371333|nr:catalase family protein [Burkholderia glumae]MCM2493028.1 catalase family protein [Burkholderia glumae]MCM2544283.1 catalase family protein [Burkholderia glumae]